MSNTEVKSSIIKIDKSPEILLPINHKKNWQGQSEYYDKNENLIGIVHIDYSLKDDHVPELQQLFIFIYNKLHLFWLMQCHSDFF